MTPESIILKHIGNIKGIRIPQAQFLAKMIMKDLAEEGYVIAPSENVKIVNPLEVQSRPRGAV